MDKTDILANQYLSDLERIEANRQGHILAELTTLSFLIDHRIATLEEIEQRIAQVRFVLGARYREEAVSQRATFSTDVLHNVYGPKQRGWTPQVIEGGLSQDQKTDPNLP